MPLGNQDAAAIEMLPAQDFASFLSQMRQEDETRRKNSETAANTRQNRQDDQARRNHADQQARRITNCDGSTSSATRTWIRQVDLSIPYSPCTVYIAAQSAQGQLQVELEHFLNSQPDRNNVTWPQLKAHLQKAFLSTHEDDRLRNELDKIKQGPYESTTSCARRFRELQILAYPIILDAAGQPTERNYEQVRLMLRAYTSGLRENNLMERLLREGRPKTVEEAMQLVVTYEADDYVVQVAREDSQAKKRVEEPMEVGAVGEVSESATDKKIAGMERQIVGLTQQFTKLMATLEKQHTRTEAPCQKSNPPAQAGATSDQKSEPSYRFTDDGQPICHYCQRVGHVRRICKTRMRHMENNQKRDANTKSGNQ